MLLEEDNQGPIESVTIGYFVLDLPNILGRRNTTLKGVDEP